MCKVHDLLGDDQEKKSLKVRAALPKTINSIGPRTHHSRPICGGPLEICCARLQIDRLVDWGGKPLTYSSCHQDECWKQSITCCVHPCVDTGKNWIILMLLIGPCCIYVFLFNMYDIWITFTLKNVLQRAMLHDYMFSPLCLTRRHNMTRFRAIQARRHVLLLFYLFIIVLFLFYLEDGGFYEFPASV